MALKQLIGGMGLLMLFAICLFLFMVQFVTLNNPEHFITTDPIVNKTLGDFQDRAIELQTLGQDSVEKLAADKPSYQYLFLIIYSAFAIPLNFIAFLLHSVGTLTGAMFTLVFGAGSSPFYLIIAAINGILMLVVVLAIIRAIRTGDSG